MVAAATPTPCFYAHDLAKSVCELLDGSGGIVTQYDYSPFGAPSRSGAASANPFMFGGEVFDEALGVSRYAFRDYVPAVGGWTTRDALGDSLNAPIDAIASAPAIGPFLLSASARMVAPSPYGFALNNPISHFDLLGYTTLFTISGINEPCYNLDEVKFVLPKGTNSIVRYGSDFDTKRAVGEKAKGLDSEAAYKSQYIASHFQQQMQRDGTIHIIAHSQGANIALHAINDLCEKHCKDNCLKQREIKAVLVAPKLNTHLSRKTVDVCDQKKCGFSVSILWITGIVDFVPNRSLLSIITLTQNPKPPESSLFFRISRFLGFSHNRDKGSPFFYHLEVRHGHEFSSYMLDRDVRSYIMDFWEGKLS